MPFSLCTCLHPSFPAHSLNSALGNTGSRTLTPGPMDTTSGSPILSTYPWSSRTHIGTSWTVADNRHTGERAHPRSHGQRSSLSPGTATPGSALWTPSQLWGKSKDWPQGQATHLQGQWFAPCLEPGEPLETGVQRKWLFCSRNEPQSWFPRRNPTRPFKRGHQGGKSIVF